MSKNKIYIIGLAIIMGTIITALTYFIYPTKPFTESFIASSCPICMDVYTIELTTVDRGLPLRYVSIKESIQSLNEFQMQQTNIGSNLILINLILDIGIFSILCAIILMLSNNIRNRRRLTYE